jgi:Mn2+/Fe2+ NRAMP family transporter
VSVVRPGYRTPPVGRYVHELLRRRRAGAVGLLAVVGPGLLAGLSDDDPPGITTYSIVGADYGYRLLWVLALSTAALIIFHEVAVRTGIVTGKGALNLMRERYRPRTVRIVLTALSTAYSVGEALGKPCDLDLGFHEARVFYAAFGAAIVSAGAAVLIPGVPLVRVLYLTQALNAVLLLAILPFSRALARDEALMGTHRLGRVGSLTTGLTILVIAVSVVALVVSSLG